MTQRQHDTLPKTTSLDFSWYNFQVALGQKGVSSPWQIASFYITLETGFMNLLSSCFLKFLTGLLPRVIFQLRINCYTVCTFDPQGIRLWPRQRELVMEVAETTQEQQYLVLSLLGATLTLTLRRWRACALSQTDFPFSSSRRWGPLHLGPTQEGLVSPFLFVAKYQRNRNRPKNGVVVRGWPLPWCLLWAHVVQGCHALQGYFSTSVLLFLLQPR